MPRRMPPDGELADRVPEVDIGQPLARVVGQFLPRDVADAIDDLPEIVAQKVDFEVAQPGPQVGEIVGRRNLLATALVPGF